ncbi:hypothetical protein PPYR_12564 [Photinus pyralis]|uniref:Uncharacterized protein n=1 Tax=Photinus pyralis TaxID=7054 RepID=A0A5N4A6I5_PHOPY|nr:intraflagellar transport protein 22 homolog isoform X1 [Photinus pyralis]KAB0792944.1 hypothetical protein PPYR_12564 [Photinus pyralis]
MPHHKVKVLLIGPVNSGKSRFANFLCDLDASLPEDIRPTQGLRILEYEIADVEIGGHKCEVDVQLWDASGDEMYSSYWPVFRKNTDGVVFVYSQEDDYGVRKLDLMYNYFVTQPNLSPRACLACAMQSDEVFAKLSSTFSKVSKIVVNLDAQGEKVKQDFTKYVTSVVNTMTNK